MSEDHEEARRTDADLLFDSLARVYAEVHDLRDRLTSFNRDRDIEMDVENLSISDLCKHVNNIRRIRK